jgi:pimeloyl-ACP methyl ester carboxylesterase
VSHFNKHIYFISGLGADKSAFSKLKFDDHYELHYIDWIEPIKNETFKSYSLRLAKQITVRENCIIIGLSFGGMLAQEISKNITFEKIILISSIKSLSEIPSYFRAIGMMRLHRLVPDILLKQHSFLLRWSFGVYSQSAKLMLKSFVSKVSPTFLRWAIHIILTENFLFPKHAYLLHLHGTKDRLLPYRLISNALPIANGGHLMVHENSVEISQAIQDFLRKEN